MIRLTVNGKSRELTEPISLADFLAAFHLDRRMIVVEHNGEILPRDRYGEVMLADGDVLEIVHMVGGG